jgi:hypothetical protein
VRRRDRRLTPIAEFDDPTRADEAWALLEEAGIPSSVVTDPSTFGSPDVTRIYVARIDVERAQSVIAPLVNR